MRDKQTFNTSCGVAFLAAGTAMSAFFGIGPSSAFPWEMGILGIVFIVAVWMAVRAAQNKTPDTTLEKAVELILGSAMWGNPPHTASAIDIGNVFDLLMEMAAQDKIYVWGTNQPFRAFNNIKSPPIKISPQYWQDHQINSEVFYTNRGGETQRLLSGFNEPWHPNLFSGLRFDRSDIKLVRRAWEKKNKPRRNRNHTGDD